MATLSPVTMCVPCFTLPKVPFPLVLPMMKPPMTLPSQFFSFSGFSVASVPVASPALSVLFFLPSSLTVAAGFLSAAAAFEALSLSLSLAYSNNLKY